MYGRRVELRDLSPCNVKFRRFRASSFNRVEWAISLDHLPSNSDPKSPLYDAPLPQRLITIGGVPKPRIPCESEDIYTKIIIPACQALNSLLYTSTSRGFGSFLGDFPLKRSSFDKTSRAARHQTSLKVLEYPA